MRAGLSSRYTNGSFWPANITELLLARFTNRKVSEFTVQKNHAIIEQYKRNVELMSEKDGLREEGAPRQGQHIPK